MPAPRPVPIDALHFEPLSAPLTAADKAAAKKFRPPTGASYWSAMFAAFMAVFGISTFIMLFLLAFLGNSNPGSLLVIPGIVIATVSIPIIMYCDASRSTTKVRLSKFAAANDGIRFISGLGNRMYKGFIFSIGSTHDVDAALIFPGRAEIGNFTFTIGTGSYRGGILYGYIRLKLTERFPQIVLDGTANNPFHQTSNLVHTFKHSQIVPIGGDFDKHFTVYVPNADRAAVERILTPELAAALVEYGKNYDVEIIDDELYVYHERFFKLSNETVLRDLLQFVEKISGALVDHTAQYDEVITAASIQAYKIQSVQRLKLSSVSGSGIIICFVVLLAVAIVASVVISSIMPVIVFSAVFLVFLVVALLVRKSNRP